MQYLALLQLHSVLLLQASALLALVYVVYRISKYLDKKTEYDEAHHERWAIESVMYDAVAYAEEQAYKAKRAERAPISGEEKLAIAVQYAEDALQETYVFGISKSFIEKIVEATVHNARKGNT